MFSRGFKGKKAKEAKRFLAIERAYVLMRQRIRCLEIRFVSYKDWKRAKM